jgi:hypothetical protein
VSRAFFCSLLFAPFVYSFVYFLPFVFFFFFVLCVALLFWPFQFPTFLRVQKLVAELTPEAKGLLTLCKMPFASLTDAREALAALASSPAAHQKAESAKEEDEDAFDWPGFAVALTETVHAHPLEDGDEGDAAGNNGEAAERLGEVLEAIGDACRLEDARAPLGESDALLDAVCAALKLKENAATTPAVLKRARLASRAAGNLCFDNEDNRPKLVSRGAVESCAALLARAVGTDAEDDDIQESLRSVSGALANIGCDYDDAQTRARDVGALSNLVAAVRGAGCPGRLSGVGGQALVLVTRALCNLSDPAATRRAYVDAGLVPVLREALERFEHDDFSEVLQNDSTTLLWNMLEGESDEAVRADALEQGALDILQFIMRVGAEIDDFDASGSVVDALDDICGDPGSVSTAVAKSALVPMLMNYVRWHLTTYQSWFSQSPQDDSEEAKEIRGRTRKAVRVLSSLSQDENATQVLLDSKAVHWLVSDFVMRWEPEDLSVDTEMLLSGLLTATNIAISPQAAKVIGEIDAGLFGQVLRLLNEHSDLRVHHASIGLLRNFALDFETRGQLLKLGWLDAIQKQLCKDDKPNPLVVFSAIGALRSLIAASSTPEEVPQKPSDEERASAWTCVGQLLEGGGFQALIELARGERATPEKPENDVDDAVAGDAEGSAKVEQPEERDRRVEFESSRMLARMASSKPDSDATRAVAADIRGRLVKNDAVGTLVSLVTSPHEILQIEGLCALRDMAASGGDVRSAIASNEDVVSAIRAVQPSGANGAAVQKYKDGALSSLDA